MEKNKQTQNAGENSHQLQVGTMNVYNGITEERAREIYREEFDNYGAVRTQEALAIAQQRVQKFEDTVIPRMAKIDKALDIMADPAFQFVLRDAQKTAAATERESDYEVLSELLIDRINNKTDRKRSLNISEAIKTVDKIDDDALCYLTLIFAINRIQPVTGNILEGIKVLSSVLSSLIVCDFPSNDEWIYHLELLNTIRINRLGRMKKIVDFYSDALSGYTCIGIEKNTKSYEQAIELLKNVGLFPQMFLVEHELNPGFVRINTRTIADVKNVSVNIKCGLQMQTALTDEQYKAMKEVIKLYENDVSKKNEIKKRFEEELLSYNSIKMVSSWWDNLEFAIELTSVGTVLANANAQKLNPEIPKVPDYND